MQAHVALRTAGGAVHTGVWYAEGDESRPDMETSATRSDDDDDDECAAYSFDFQADTKARWACCWACWGNAHTVV